MKIWGDILMLGGGRIRGLTSALNPDEPVRKAEAGTGSGGYQPKRVQSEINVSGSFVCNWADYDEIRVTLSGATTFTFIGALDGQGVILTIKGSGATVALPANTRRGQTIPQYVGTGGSGNIDKLGFSYDINDAKYDLVSVVKQVS